MRALAILLLLLVGRYGYGQTWNVSGTNIVLEGSNLHRDGNLSSNHLNSITSPTIVNLVDTFYADIGVSGTYSMMALSDSLPAGTLTQDNSTNKHIKFGFFHGYAASGNFLRIVENGVQLNDSLVGTYKKLRIILDPDGVIYQKSRDGATWVTHRRGAAPAGGNYYPVLQLQNQNTFSAWNNVRISRAPVGRCQFVDTTCQIVKVYIPVEGGYALDESGTAFYKAMFGVFPPSLKDAPVVEQFVIGALRYTLYKNGAWRREKIVAGTWTDDPF